MSYTTPLLMEQTGLACLWTALHQLLLRSQENQASPSRRWGATSGSSTSHPRLVLTHPWRMRWGDTSPSPPRSPTLGPSQPPHQRWTRPLSHACWPAALSTTTCCTYGVGTGAQGRLGQMQGRTMLVVTQPQPQPPESRNHKHGWG